MNTPNKNNRLTIKLSVLILSFSFAFSSQVIAEQQLIKISKQGNTTIQTPIHGKNMEDVRTEFGEPIEKVTEIGQPPITRWVYKNFTVYFESNIVIHTVLKK